MDFKESGFMYAVALGVVAFVIAQSIFFIVKAWKRGKQLGLSGEKMKNTIVSSILFTIAPVDPRHSHRARKCAGHSAAVD